MTLVLHGNTGINIGPQGKVTLDSRALKDLKEDIKVTKVTRLTRIQVLKVLQGNVGPQGHTRFKRRSKVNTGLQGPTGVPQVPDGGASHNEKGELLVKIDKITGLNLPRSIWS